MEGPSLKLIVVKGPREGETLESNSLPVIRIGRVVRGNTFAIKDAGISSKHISIEFTSGKWAIQDLNSSNGTLLNGNKLQPLTPFEVHDGDAIKIGECTSIEVKIDASDQAPQVRRNLRRRAAAKDGGSEIAAPVAETRGRRARTRALKEENLEAGVGLGTENGDLQEGLDGKLGNGAVAVADKRSRHGRTKKAGVLKNEDEEGVRKVRKDEEVDTLGPVEEKQGRRMSSRRTRSSKNEKQSTSNSMLQTVQEASGFNQDECREVENLAPVEGKKARAGRTRRKNLKDDPPEVVEVDVLNDKENVDELNIGQETCNQSESTSGIKESDTGKVVDVPDLEKMTLGEWFDYLEVYLPKQICEATDEIIEAMRQKSKQVSEYVAQQMNEKGKLPMDYT
ncbi:FHA domain-containing protein At4g14490 [Malania oleifera]|uniref:FHA domain-containing protein At4g14490 n=1 Tax=Malania oleifera TaxID=397392 RepID=UPI0025AE1614|nr:FHA domain-containing protein At4g14490 [Malania oleifera]